MAMFVVCLFTKVYPAKNGELIYKRRIFDITDTISHPNPVPGVNTKRYINSLLPPCDLTNCQNGLSISYVTNYILT